MANPTLPHDTQKLNHDGVYVEVEGIIVNDEVVVKAQEATIADAVVAHSLTAEATDSPDRAETDSALDALGVKINAILTALENHGLLADA